mgnify:FL=1
MSGNCYSIVTVVTTVIENMFAEGIKGMEPMRRRGRRKRRTSLYLVMLVVGIFLATLIIQGAGLQADCRRLTAEKSQLEQKKKNLEKEQQKIVEKEKYMQTDKYIEDMAREKFGLVYDNEIIFKPADSE